MSYDGASEQYTDTNNINTLETAHGFGLRDAVVELAYYKIEELA
jgi:hypothetical protein